MTAPRATVVLLNGVGSVGKSSLAAALQAIARRPMLHVRMDDFAAMLPERLQDHADGFLFEAVAGPAGPEVHVRTGPAGARLMAGFRAAVAALAAAGSDLIVDDVWLDGEPPEYATLLAPFRTLRVGLFAPLDVLEARERARGDRRIGLARAQVERVHRGVAYDLALDMAALTPGEGARRVAARFGL